MFVGLNMSFPDELGSELPPAGRWNGTAAAKNVSFVFGGDQFFFEFVKCFFAVGASVENGNNGEPQHLGVSYCGVPIEKCPSFPNVEDIEVAFEFFVNDGVLGKHVLAADFPILRDFMFDSTVEGFNPASGIVFFAIYASGMNVVGVECGTLSVDFAGNDNFRAGLYEPDC